MVWSPPMATSRPPPRSNASAPASIWPTASSALNGVQAMSPASTTWASSKGKASNAGLYGRSRREPWRTAAGPKRAPGR